MSFDLSQCETIPATHYKAKTRDGRDVEVVFTEGAKPYPIRGIVDDECLSWMKDGRFSTFYYHSQTDLVNIPRIEYYEAEARIIDRESGRVAVTMPITLTLNPGDTLRIPSMVYRSIGDTPHTVTVEVSRKE